MRRILVLLFTVFFLKSISQSAQRVIDSLENLIKTLSDKNRLYTEKSALLLKYYTTGNHAKGEKIFKETMAQAQKENSDFGLGSMYNAKGILLYYKADFDSSLYYLEKALTYRKKAKDNIGTLKNYSNIGGIYFLRYEYKKALEYYDEGLKMEESLGYPEGEYISLNNLGRIHATLKINDKAISYFRKAEKKHLKSGEMDDLVYSYDGISSAFDALGKHDSALFYAQKAKQIAIKMGEIHSYNYELVTVATILMKQKKFDEARKNLDTALQLCLQNNEDRLKLAVYGNLAIIEMERNNMDSSFKFLEEVMALQKKLKVTASIEDEPKLFAEYYYRKKDYKKAYDYLMKYNSTTDSLYQSDISLQLNDMRTKYETEKKEKENQLLQVENRTYKTTRNYLLIILGIAILGIIGAIIAYRKIKSSKELIGIQKQLVEEKQKEILDSINYAKRIQFALLASDNLLKENLPDHFVFFKPKDVVSGDFYWGCPTEEGFIYITADCTGHGVPGAFMSLLNISKLSQVISEKRIHRPDLILNEIRTEIIKALNPGSGQEPSKDGMDAVLCKLNVPQRKLEFSAANNSFYIIREGKIMHCKADKMPVGKGHDDTVSFSYNEIALHKGDVIYTFTDGFADQFGGMMGKKFKYKQLEELLLSIHHEPMQAQKQKLDDVLEKWKGSLEQVDDICIIGVKIT